MLFLVLACFGWGILIMVLGFVWMFIGTDNWKKLDQYVDWVDSLIMKMENKL